MVNNLKDEFKTEDFAINQVVVSELAVFKLLLTFVMKIDVESEESHWSKHLLFITKQCVDLSRNSRLQVSNDSG